MHDQGWLDNPSVCAAVYVVDSPAGLKGPAVARRLESALAGLAEALQGEGCRLIGHIKALAHGAAQDYLYASLVSPEQGVSLRGELPTHVQQVRLTFNVIVYGIERDRLPGLLGRCVKQAFPDAAPDEGRSPNLNG